MPTHPGFDPIAIGLGPLKIHWYGLMYLVAFATAWWLGRSRARDVVGDPAGGWRRQDVDDVVFYAAIGVVLGGRLGYAAFYGAAKIIEDPWLILRVWEGGMSFHGGLLGVMVAMYWFARGRGREFFAVADFVAPLVPLGLAAGRIGNFINGNLWGKVSDVPWAMVFPRAGELPRHPSQLYQALLEGVALFVILWLYSRRPRPTMAVSGLFLSGYAVARSLVELVRVPDAHIGYLALGWVTMGHVLTVPMLLGGMGLLWLAYHRAPREESTAAPPPAPPPARTPRGKRRRRG